VVGLLATTGLVYAACLFCLQTSGSKRPGPVAGLFGVATNPLRPASGSGRAARAVHSNFTNRNWAQYIPDVIILDLMMPEMDGFQVAAALRSWQVGGTEVDQSDMGRPQYSRPLLRSTARPIRW
jgi:CheY-like chemotaxis protein